MNLIIYIPASVYILEELRMRLMPINIGKNESAMRKKAHGLLAVQIWRATQKLISELPVH